VSDACNSALMGAFSKVLDGSGLEVADSDREIALSNTRRLAKDRYIFDHSARCLAWGGQECDYWDFDHLTDGQAGWFIAGKIREVLGQRPRIASEEQARREDLSARVMTGELDDVHLNVRRT
jgi:hypothetical protein